MRAHNKKLTPAQSGLVDGAAEVLTVFQEQGLDVVRDVQHGDLGWNEHAIANRTHEMAGISDRLRMTYYRAYERGARRQAAKLLALFQKQTKKSGV